jgi:uncharacterized FAD-dependent dehydrogenase
MIRIKNLKLELKEAINHDMEITNLKKLVMAKYQVKPQQINAFSLQRKAVDARKKDHVHFVYTIEMDSTIEEILLNKKGNDISLSPDMSYPEIEVGKKVLKNRPIVVGFGPSGVFAALLLARSGYQPLVLERGLDVDNRSIKVDKLFNEGVFSAEGNILFGEGGAGTFSDGKLTTSTNNLRIYHILETFVKHGADPEILYHNKPHVGTDVLRNVMKNMRNEIISLGGEIRFTSQVTDIILDNKTIKGVVVNNQETISAEVVIMGVGHSARDTFELLYNKGLEISQKAFSMGVRIEHPQKMINVSQYGKFAEAKNLGAADYKLSYHASNGRGAYTFCMCPGGDVVCSTSEPGMVATNGMSEHKRDHVNANSGFLVNVNPGDFGSDHPLAGIEFQRTYERKAFLFGGSNYHAPIQKVGDFLNDRETVSLGSVNPSYLPGYKFAKMTDVLPSFITDTLKEALLDFDKKIKGFAMDDAIMTGVETRSSSPIRITRNENHESNIAGLYPMGEGAGYSGGITTSAVDGLKTAEQVMMKYKPLK